MPMEHERAREAKGVHVPESFHRALLLAGAGLMAFSLVRDNGEAGALTAIGAGSLGLGLGHVANKRRGK